MEKLTLAFWRGFWLFPDPPTDGWWLSVSGLCLDASWSLHNVIAWMKVAPFLPRRASQVFIWSLVMVQAYWIMEVYANFTYFHGYSKLFLRTRPWEALCRDPWWIFAALVLFWKIKTQYQMTLKDTISISPRFGLMLLAGVLSVVFFVLDICAVTNTLRLNLPNGINPFWKLSSVFKCLMDCVVLDDFKTALDRLRACKISRIGSFARDTSALHTQKDTDLTRTWEEIESNLQHRSQVTDFDSGPSRSSFRSATEPYTFNLEHAYPRQVHETALSPSSRPPDSWHSSVNDISHPEPTMLGRSCSRLGVPVRNEQGRRYHTM